MRLLTVIVLCLLVANTYATKPRGRKNKKNAKREEIDDSKSGNEVQMADGSNTLKRHTTHNWFSERSKYTVDGVFDVPYFYPDVFGPCPAEDFDVFK